MNLLSKTRCLVDAVFAARFDDIQCDEAQLLIALSTSEGLVDLESQQEYPSLWRHLDICADCAGEYRMTWLLAQLEAAGKLVVPAQVPARPGVSRSVPSDPGRLSAPVIFAGFGMATGTPARGQTEDAVVQEIMLIPDRLNLWLDLLPHEGGPDLRDLLCTAAAVGEAEQLLWEGSPVALFLEGALIMEKVLDDLGDVAFPGLKPGAYTLQLTLAGQLYTIPLYIP